MAGSPGLTVQAKSPGLRVQNESPGLRVEGWESRAESPGLPKVELHYKLGAGERIALHASQTTRSCAFRLSVLPLH